MGQTAKLRISKIEDYEWQGICSSCRREHLRWIVTLSDGTQVGFECAKKILGFRPSPDRYQWITYFRPVAEHVEGSQTWVLWEHKTRNETRETRDGHLMTVGGARKDWQQRGWAA